MLTVIIVPGAETKSSKLFRWLTDKFYKHYGVDTEQGHWAENLKLFLENHSKAKVGVFHWSGGISQASLEKAAVGLKKMIDDLPESDEVVLFAKSLGGNLVDIALQSVEHKIKKVIYVAVPHRLRPKKHIQKTELVNIYSKDDNYIDLAIKVLYWGRGVKRLSGAENIVLEKLRHSDLNKNKKLWYQGKEWDLYSFYQRFICS